MIRINQFAVAVLASLPILGWGTALRQVGKAAPIRVLVVGGGPDQSHNQAAIESNVRYIDRLLPSGSAMRVLFTDGNPQSENVQCQSEDKKIYYRAPQLPRQDGPSKSASVQAELSALATSLRARPATKTLLYFTGHGSPDRQSAYNDNHYDLWDGDKFSVRDLAGAIKAFPKATPITVVMVQCYSGAFGNLLFQDGDPTETLVDQHICGFFAAVPQRMAAGCTPVINEAEYRDFTGYFFSALTGTDRLGRPITGVDYNHDGKVGMNEAFDYSLLHDDSIDTPVCTSDTFLRRFVKTADGDIFKTSYSQVQAWASPGQLAALEGLSKLLSFSGEDQLATAFDHFTQIGLDSFELNDVHLIRYVRLAKSIVLGHTLNTTGDKSVKARYAELVKAEAGNPLKD